MSLLMFLCQVCVCVCVFPLSSWWNHEQSKKTIVYLLRRLYCLLVSCFLWAELGGCSLGAWFVVCWWPSWTLSSRFQSSPYNQLLSVASIRMKGPSCKLCSTPCRLQTLTSDRPQTSLSPSLLPLQAFISVIGLLRASSLCRRKKWANSWGGIRGATAAVWRLNWWKHSLTVFTEAGIVGWSKENPHNQCLHSQHTGTSCSRDAQCVDWSITPQRTDLVSVRSDQTESETEH